MQSSVTLILCALVAITVLAAGCISDPSGNVINPAFQAENESSHNTPFSSHIVTGGAARDSIPPIETPRFITIEEADRSVDDTDIIFLIESEDNARIYPRLIMVWHEIVSDTIEGIPVAVTYCPLTGSAIRYNRTISGKTTTFGTSGKLLSSNLVMYDRDTESYWSQIMGLSIQGERAGSYLDLYPVIWTTYGKAKQRYPNALVLSQDTGHVRPYGADPYGFYDDPDGYYLSGGPFFPVLNSDPRLPDKEVVYGIRLLNETVAVRKSFLRERGIVEFELGTVPLVAWYDPELDTIRVFERDVHDILLSFTVSGDELRDNQTHSVWHLNGTGMEGTMKGVHLTPVTGFELMWFGWAGFYPDTRLIQD